MKSAFKEVFIKADSLTVDLNEVIKTASRDIKIAYILHDKNVGAESHYHIFLDYGANRVDDNAAMQLLNVCNRCVVSARSKDWTEIKRYMVHTHDYEYSLSDIVANFDLSMY